MTYAHLDAPEVPVLLLGDPAVGKSTFLSRLTLGSNATGTYSELPTLRDLDQPFPFNLRLYNRPYRVEFYDNGSPTNFTLLQPALIVLCYSIASPQSLSSVQKHWKPLVDKHFNHNEDLPVILLGLMRDLRSKEDYDGTVRTNVGPVGDGDDGRQPLVSRTIVYPQEAERVAQEMRCDLYCECSAITGELCSEAFEDIMRTAARTTTPNGGQSRGTTCNIM